MKNRLVLLICLMALVVVASLCAIRTTMMKDVPSDEFETYIIDHGPSQLGERRVAGSARLSMLMEIRFPKTETAGGLGFPDRIDVFGFKSGKGLTECHAHIRQNHVCLVTFEGIQPSSEFRKQLSGRFPGLTIR